MPDRTVTIGVVDYGAGNLRSVQNALRHLRAESVVITDPLDIGRVDGIILPGVGSFGYAVEALAKAGLVTALRKAARAKPLLGICLGMQLLFSSSEESPDAMGLGILRGSVVKLASGPLQKVPNMGWRLVTTRCEGLLGPAGSTTSYYFAHSYVCEPGDARVISACTGGDDAGFVAAVQSGLVHGVQFHPEKSGECGLKVLESFLGLCAGGPPC